MILSDNKFNVKAAPKTAEKPNSSLGSNIKGFFRDKLLQTKAFALNTVDASPTVKMVKAVKDMATDKMLQTKAFLANQVEDSEIVNTYKNITKRSQVSAQEEIETIVDVTTERVEEIVDTPHEELNNLVQFPIHRVQQVAEPEAVNEVVPVQQVVPEDDAGFDMGAYDRDMRNMEARKVLSVSLKQPLADEAIRAEQEKVSARKVVSIDSKKKDKDNTVYIPTNVFAQVVKQNAIAPELKKARITYAEKLNELEEAMNDPKITIYDVPTLAAKFADRSVEQMLTVYGGEVISPEEYVYQRLFPNDRQDMMQAYMDKASKYTKALEEKEVMGSIVEADFTKKTSSNAPDELQDLAPVIDMHEFKKENDIRKLANVDATLEEKGRHIEDSERNRWRVLRSYINTSLIRDPLQRTVLSELIEGYTTRPQTRTIDMNKKKFVEDKESNPNIVA